MTLHDDLCAAYGWPAEAVWHGEAGIYTPAGGAAVAVTVVVNRAPLEMRRGDVHVARPEYELTALVSQDEVATVNVHGDTLAIKKRVGDAANTTYTVSRLLGQDGGRWLVGLS